MVKATSAVLASTLLAGSAMAWESASTTTTAKLVDPATTDAPWLDWTSSTTTTKKVDPVKSTTTTADPWADWTSSSTTTKKVDPVKSTSTTYDPWVDWTSSTTTTKKVDPAKTTSTTHYWADWTSSSVKPVDPAVTSTSTWGDWTPVDPAVCAAVTVTYTGVGFWVPDPAGAWADWTSTSSAKPTTVKPTVKTTTTVVADPTWSDWVSSTTTTLKTVVSTTTTPAHNGWGSSSTTKAASTTTKAPSAAPTCPSDNKKSVLAGGSCGCSFTVNCGVKASPDAKSLFWEKVSGGIVPTLAECLAQCDSNDKCEAALWVDDATNGDYHHCWQISGLGAPTGDGVAQISYKGTCSGKCSESYTKS